MKSFSCPYCSIPLRVRDRSKDGQTIRCPDCDEPIQLDWENEAFIGIKSKTKAFESPNRLSSHSKFVLACIGAGLAVLIGISIVMWPQEEIESSKNNSHNAKVRRPQSIGPDINEDAESDGVNSLQSIKESLKTIHQELNRFQSIHDHFPNGNGFESESEPNRWSWIAELYHDGFDDGVVPVWGQPWNSPANDPFVRRRMNSFLNPLLDQRSGDDRYPATHFAGLSGVGADAARLPARHPRAGIFSEVRTTQVSDVLDGTANTIMVVGVQDHLGSWARPGLATIRSFQQEPYVNGPDGIGTGQSKSMMVLMADGSVREISQEIEPKIARRMATINDGMTLDPSTAGDPLLAETSDSIGPAHKQPAEPEVTEVDDMPDDDRDLESQPMTTRQRLQQKIAAYSVPTPVAVGDLLYEFQELAAIRIDLEGLTETQRATEIMIDVEDVSLEDLLGELLLKAGLKSEMTPTTIRIVSRDDASVQ